MGRDGKLEVEAQRRAIVDGGTECARDANDDQPATLPDASWSDTNTQVTRSTKTSPWTYIVSGWRRASITMAPSPLDTTGAMSGEESDELGPGRILRLGAGAGVRNRVVSATGDPSAAGPPSGLRVPRPTATRPPITAAKASKKTGGRWRRPPIRMASKVAPSGSRAAAGFGSPPSGASRWPWRISSPPP